MLQVGASTAIHALLIGRAYAVSGGNPFIAAGLGLIIVLYNGLLIPFLAGFDAGLENSVSVILICRFTLQLRKFNTRVQTVPSVHIASTPGIRERLQCIHETLIEEFGNSEIEYDLETENDMVELEGDTAPSTGIDTEVYITADEFPWVINPVESAPSTLGSGNP
ncbi:hypothetical protein M422DRAFT_267514 [Sphaerobolus stellatus SS14]|uniref:Uncharacterized protein n=1 Tax=Sphaerobolus stellatus (strain SS14) TaxID=990650 RepID=A0A0C9U902_SPHS4|nr:hypothetical protein M422DRAFT_267514 [Sphaerobolus stellatus SS14]